ncbi:hypothetical protein O181_038519 [Austropuccinia psidii MF-1]|uniref:Uncharacterized protein n=1 Tax=Austropuccinia psidii MF-1 TaxID=1389203 RepID=A0A9Q3HDM7_9BASI|nr:hypothetical protein [Austropuccinia psidii MF-1]
MLSNKSGARYNPSRSSQEGDRRDYGEANQLQKDKGQAETATRSLSGHIQSQPEGLEKCISAQRVPDPCRFVEKLNQFFPECEKIPGPSQNLQVTQLMESIDGKEKNDALNSRMEEKQPSTTQASANNNPSSQKKKFQHEKAAKNSEQGKRKSSIHKNLQPGLQNPKDSEGFHGKCISDGQNNYGIGGKGGSQIKISEMIFDILDGIPNLYIAINDIKNHISDKNLSIYNNLKTND